MSASQNPSTLKPGTKFDTKRIIRALITKVKSPIVMMLIGRVKSVITGVKNVFTIASTTATPIAGSIPASVTHGRI